MQKTPDEELAARIVQRLQEAVLLAKSYADQPELMIAAGTAKEQDWRLWAERALDRSRTEEAP